MAAKIICFIAFVCSANCNPLGPTTICETGNVHPNFVPSLSGTAVSESLSNLMYPHGFGTIVDPRLLGLGYHSVGIPAPSTTVIESNTPAVNLSYLGALQGLGVPGMMGYGLGPLGLPGLGFGVPGYGLTGLGNVDSATVRESVPNVVSLGYPYPGMGLANIAPVAGTTVCESPTPNLLGLGYNSPLGRPFL